MTIFVAGVLSTLQRFALHAIILLVIAGTAAIWTVRRYLGDSPSASEAGWTVFAICLLAEVFGLGVYLISRDRQRLKRSAYDFHDINHIYRDALSGVLSIYAPTKPDSREILLVEQNTLNRICVKIAHLFTSLTGKKCVVTVKLLANEGDTAFCFTWARSHVDILRSASGIEKFRVGVGENTGFDEAMKLRDSETSYFFSPDLRTLSRRGRYRNARSGWANCYLSTIVVPIRQVIRTGDPPEVHVFGFLCVDTMSPNRLNGTYHVQFLAGFADQMYNFLSIMRRTYLLTPSPTVEKEGSTPIESAL
jgi:hypothetical protein